MRLHGREKPYVCSLCVYRRAFRGNLKLHMKTHERSQKVSGPPLTLLTSKLEKVTKYALFPYQPFSHALE